MSAQEETPAQRQARIRQQKREAKIKASGQDRLDSITKLSGRAPETMSTSSPIRPSTPQTSASTTTVSSGQPRPSTGDWMAAQADTPEQRRLQEEYMRVLLGGGQPGQTGQPPQAGQPGEEDPMIKMMQTMLGGMSGDPNAPSTGELPFSADDISKMTGIPSFLTGMFMGNKQAPPSAEQISRERIWKIIRIVLSILIGVYTIFTLDYSLTTFGKNPPAPATVRNPFYVFLTAQLLVNGAKAVFTGNSSSQAGLKTYYRRVKDVAADGAVVIFMLGIYSWWSGLA